MKRRENPQANMKFMLLNKGGLVACKNNMRKKQTRLMKVSEIYGFSPIITFQPLPSPKDNNI